MNLSLDEISKAVEGALEGSGTVNVRGYSIDSRTIKPGELFFAIKGPRFDGHDFLPQVFQKGAAAAVVEEDLRPSPGPPSAGPPSPTGREARARAERERGSAKPQEMTEASSSEARARQGEASKNAGGPMIRVTSTLTALQNLARDVRRRWGMTIIGITGSAGKTTTKELTAAVLGKKFTVLRSVGNLNNEFGLPLCLLRVERYQNIGVLEMGMSAKGELRKLASIAEPNEGVVTNVNPVHLEFFKSIDEIAEAKAELVEALNDPKIAYLNSDDSRVRAMARKTDGKIVTYGVKSVASFKVQQIQDLGLDGTAFTVHHGRRDLNFVLPLLGQHNVTNAVAAVAVGATHEVAWEQIREALAEMKPEKMRGQVLRFREGFSVIDDTYNFNPT